MSAVFAEAVTAAMRGHTADFWAALPQRERAIAIYAEMRKIDAESVERWTAMSTERQAA
jgi:hypothetical protein